MSSSTLPPPLSLRNCYADGVLDVIRYCNYSKKRRQIHSNHLLPKSMTNKNLGRKTKPVDMSMKRQRYRSVKKHETLVRDPSGSLREIKPIDTSWRMLHIESSPRKNSLRKLFRRRFRLPHH